MIHNTESSRLQINPTAFYANKKATSPKIAVIHPNPRQQTTEPENKQPQDRTHEYTNIANNINIPPNISNITEIETTNNHRKTLKQMI